MKLMLVVMAMFLFSVYRCATCATVAAQTVNGALANVPSLQSVLDKIDAALGR